MIIGCFKIVSETALATGTRRIVAVTGNAAINLLQQTHTIVKNLSEVFKAKAEDICDAITKLQQSHQKSLIEIKNLKKQLIHANIASIAKDMILIGKIHFLYFETENMGNEELKMICQELEKTSPGFYFLVNKDSTNNTCSFLGFVSKCFHNLIDAKLCFDTLKKTHTTLRGGGSISMIQGSGILQKNLKDDIMNWLKERCI